MIWKIAYIVRTRGFPGLMRAIGSRMLGLFAGKANSFHVIETLLCGKTGLEIGGPSQVFSRRGIFPVYSIVEHLDNCNFSNTTVWGDGTTAGPTYQFDRHKSAGHQFIAEATAMGCIPSDTYDFLLSSHMLEHTANPILALTEWIRLLKEQGVLVLLLPHKDKTFDHRRPVTSIEHLIADFKAGMGEDDLTHVNEILALHDLELDPQAGNAESFKARSMRNYQNRCLHHHVFDTDLAVRLIEYLGLKILEVEVIQPHHILIVAEKVSSTKSGITS